MRRCSRCGRWNRPPCPPRGRRVPRRFPPTPTWPRRCGVLRWYGVLLDAFHALFDDLHACEGVGKVRRMALGHKRADAQRNAVDLGEVFGKRDHSLNIVVVLGAEADHHVDLDALEAQITADLGGFGQVLGGDALFQPAAAQTLIRRVGGHREGSQAARLQNFGQFCVHGIGADGRYAQFDAPVCQGAAHIFGMRKVAEGRAHQTQTFCTQSGITSSSSCA